MPSKVSSTTIVSTVWLDSLLGVSVQLTFLSGVAGSVPGAPVLSIPATRVVGTWRSTSTDDVCRSALPAVTAAVFRIEVPSKSALASSGTFTWTVMIIDPPATMPGVPLTFWPPATVKLLSPSGVTVAVALGDITTVIGLVAPGSRIRGAGSVSSTTAFVQPAVPVDEQPTWMK